MKDWIILAGNLGFINGYARMAISNGTPKKQAYREARKALKRRGEERKASR